VLLHACAHLRIHAAKLPCIPIHSSLHSTDSVLAGSLTHSPNHSPTHSLHSTPALIDSSPLYCAPLSTPTPITSPPLTPLQAMACQAMLCQALLLHSTFTPLQSTPLMRSYTQALTHSPPPSLDPAGHKAEGGGLSCCPPGAHSGMEWQHRMRWRCQQPGSERLPCHQQSCRP
jgi:hypothetical protein